MNSLKLIAIALLSFLISIFVLRPELFNAGMKFDQSVHQESQASGGELNADYKKLFDLDIPKSNVSEQRWRTFLSDVKSTTGADGERPMFRYSTF